MTSSSYYTYHAPSSEQNNNEQSEGTDNRRVGVEQIQIEGVIHEG